MNSKEQALQFKKEAEQQRVYNEEFNRLEFEYSVGLQRQFAEWIIAEFMVFEPEFNTIKKWFAGCDYYCLSREGKIYVSCVINGREMMTQAGQWAGPHDKTYTSHSSNLEDLQRHIALIMRNFV